MEKDWKARFEASERKPRSLIDHLWLVEMLGSLGLVVGVAILAADYFRSSRDSFG